MKYNYSAIYEKNAKMLNAKPRLKRALLLFNGFVPYFFALAYALLLGYALVELSPKDLALLIAAPASALFAVTALRFFVDRPRPYSQAGAGIIPLQEKKGAGCSFPSRHLASATVISVCFLPYLPLVGALLFPLVFLLAYARFAAGWHYLSDLIVGALLGAFFGTFLFIL